MIEFELIGFFCLFQRCKIRGFYFSNLAFYYKSQVFYCGQSK